MLRVLFLIVLLTLFGAGSAIAAEGCAYADQNAAAAPVALKRGVNLSRWWEDDHHQALDPDDAKKLAALGLDFVRLPVSPSRLVLDDEDDQKEALAQLRCDIVSLLDANLAVIVDLHAQGRFQHNLAEDSGSDAAQRLETIWKNMQPALNDLPSGRVLLGLYNEPQIDTDSWWAIQEKLVKSLRTVYPDNPFVVTAGPDGGPWNLESEEPYVDKNLIYDFHFYQPMQFTHHGADWLSSYEPGDKSVKIVYPEMSGATADEDNANLKDYIAGDWDRDRLKAFIDKIADWAQQKNVKIACFEFGVYRPYVDADSRAHWLEDMRELLEQDHIPWSMWEYRGNFGLLDAGGAPDAGVVKALGLKQDTSQ